MRQSLAGNSFTIGVISDTHGLVRPQALKALEGTDLILHAGDIGSQEVLDALSTVAPVTAVRGNTDCGHWSEKLQQTETAEISGLLLFLLHDLDSLDLDPTAAGINAVISGHSHRPLIREDKGILYLNPGSAGPRRFSLPPTLALIRIRGNRLLPELVHLT